MVESDDIANVTEAELEAAEKRGASMLVHMLRAKQEIGSLKERAYRDLHVFGRQLLGIMLLADDLNETMTLESEVSELKSTETALKASVAELDQRQASLTEQIAAGTHRLEIVEAELREHDAAIAVRHQQAADKARDAGQEIIAEAKTVAEQFLTEAREKAAAEAARHEADTCGRQANIAALDADIAARQGELQRINAVIAEARARLQV